MKVGGGSNKTNKKGTGKPFYPLFDSLQIKSCKQFKTDGEKMVRKNALDRESTCKVTNMQTTGHKSQYCS